MRFLGVSHWRLQKISNYSRRKNSVCIAGLASLAGLGLALPASLLRTKPIYTPRVYIGLSF